jgi:hypothetical protein
LQTIDIEYRFKLPDTKEESFQLQLDPHTIEVMLPLGDDLPEWTRLEFQQCPNCPYQKDMVPHCPAAVCMVDVVRRFNGLVSYDEVEIEIITSERHVVQPTTAQQGISSMMGLLIAASGCPRSAYFKPMARFHLPLSQPEETMYRATTMYLLAQYFRKQADQDYEMGLDGLASIYRNMQIINNSLADRIRAASETDSSVNALILLDMHAKTLTYVIEDYLDELRDMFSAYF